MFSTSQQITDLLQMYLSVNSSPYRWAISQLS